MAGKQNGGLRGRVARTLSELDRGTRRRAVFGYGVARPRAYRRRTITASPERSTSRRSSAVHSFVRSPVSAAKVTRAPEPRPNSSAMASISSAVNGSTSSNSG